MNHIASSGLGASDGTDDAGWATSKDKSPSFAETEEGVERNLKDTATGSTPAAPGSELCLVDTDDDHVSPEKTRLSNYGTCLS